MRSLSIRKKLMLAGAVLTLVIVSQVVIALIGTENIRQEISGLSNNQIRMLILSKDIQFSVAQVQQWLTDISATRAFDGLNDGFDEAAAHADSFRGYINELSGIDKQNASTYREISTSFETYYASGQRMAQAYIDQGPLGGNKMMGEFDASAADLIGKLEPVLAQIAHHTSTGFTTTNEHIISLEKIVLVVSIVILFFLAACFFLVHISIRSIEKLGETIFQIADGDGDLTRTVTVKNNDEVGLVAEGFNRFVDVIRGMVVTVAETSNHLSANAENSSEVMTKTSRDIVSQKDDTLQVAAAIGEISATGMQTASKAEEAADAVKTTEEAAFKGQKSVEEVVTSINGLAAEVESASKVIERLEGYSDEIGNILNVIRSVAEQTNLLALNAAIEAARAGEQGRGFAVVADEVRTLATRTQESTSEIQSTIEQLQNGAREAACVMESGRTIAKTTVVKASEAQTQLNSIVEDVKTLNSVNGHIAHSTAEQNDMISEMLVSIGHISQIADQTAESAKQTATANQNLMALSNDLSSSIKQFKI